MIEIPFSFLGLTDWILSFDEPITIIMFATFGVLFSMAVILPLMSVTPFKKYTAQIAGGLFTSIFASLMILISFHLMLGVNSSLKLLLIWWVILFSSITFWLLNYDYIKDTTGDRLTKLQEKALELEEKKRQQKEKSKNKK